MTAKQLLWFGNRYAYEDDFSEVLEQINTELSDAAVSLETHFNDAFTKSLKKHYSDLLEKRNMILFMQEQRLVLFHMYRESAIWASWLMRNFISTRLLTRRRGKGLFMPTKSTAAGQQLILSREPSCTLGICLIRYRRITAQSLPRLQTQKRRQCT